MRVATSESPVGYNLRRRRETPAHRVLRVTRATTALIIIALGLGLALASLLGVLIWAIAAAIHHAAGS
jgi:hypothetical protein